MTKGISGWLAILLISLVAVFAFLATFFVLRNNLVTFSNPSSKVTLTGVLKYGYLINPKHDYCISGNYIESLQGPFTGNETSLLLKPGPASNFSSTDLYSNVNNVLTVSGTLVKGQACSVKNSCDCDDFVFIDSAAVDATKSATYAASLPTYEGIIKCFFPEGTTCAPVLTSSSGKKYQLIDVANNYDLAHDGKHIKIWANYDTDPSQLAGEAIDGSLYVAKAASF